MQFPPPCPSLSGEPRRPQLLPLLPLSSLCSCAPPLIFLGIVSALNDGTKNATSRRRLSRSVRAPPRLREEDDRAVNSILSAERLCAPSSPPGARRITGAPSTSPPTHSSTTARRSPVSPQSLRFVLNKKRTVICHETQPSPDGCITIRASARSRVRTSRAQRAAFSFSLTR